VTLYKVAIIFIVSGLIWQLPFNWLVFIPVAFFWILVTALISAILLSLLNEILED
jgi:hypothetical protein